QPPNPPHPPAIGGRHPHHHAPENPATPAETTADAPAPVVEAAPTIRPISAFVPHTTRTHHWQHDASARSARLSDDLHHPDTDPRGGAEHPHHQFYPPPTPQQKNKVAPIVPADSAATHRAVAPARQLLASA